MQDIVAKLEAKRAEAAMGGGQRRIDNQHAKGKLTFLARDSEQAIIQEREKKRSGMYDQGENAPAQIGMLHAQPHSRVCDIH